MRRGYILKGCKYRQDFEWESMGTGKKTENMDKIKIPINKAAEQAANEKYSYFQGVLFLKLTDWNLEQQGKANTNAWTFQKLNIAQC